MSQEERSIFWEVTVSVILSKNVYVNVSYSEQFPGERHLYSGLAWAPSIGVPGGKVNILGGHSIGHSKQKCLYEHVSYSKRFPRQRHLTVHLQYSGLAWAPSIVLPSCCAAPLSEARESV